MARRNEFILLSGSLEIKSFPYICEKVISCRIKASSLNKGLFFIGDGDSISQVFFEVNAGESFTRESWQVEMSGLFYRSQKETDKMFLWLTVI